MAYEVKLQVTQPYHGDGGVLLHEPGRLFAQDEDLPEGIRVTPVVVEAEDKPEEKVEAKPAKAVRSAPVP